MATEAIARQQYYAMSPEIALELSRQLAAQAHTVMEARKTKPGAYIYVSVKSDTRDQFRIRIGDSR